MSRSNVKNTPYHHGDLRNTLIKTGVKMLGEQGEQGISMRKLAKEAGVSHNAPYMHFADKEALLVAIAEEGFAILSQRVSEAIAAPGNSWHERLHDGCWAYVQFALEHPSHLNVMFRPYDLEKYPSYYEVSSRALEILQDMVNAGQHSENVIRGDSKEIATMLWSLLHGVSTIMTGRKMPPKVMGDLKPEELVHRFVELVYSGLAPQ